jgi:hypothetical protein
MTLNVAALASADEPEVDRFVATLPRALLYHRPAWRHLLRELLGCQEASLVARDGSGSIVGVLPLLSAEGRWGRVFNSLPFYGSNGGILAATAPAAEVLAQAYSQLAVQPDVASATTVDTPGLPANAVSANVGDSRIGQITPIGQAEDHEGRLMASFHYKTRNAIRKAEKSGVQVHREDDAFDFLLHVHQENMAAIGGKPKPARFFELAARHFRAGSDYRIHVARIAGEPVAALLTFFAQKTVEYFTPVVRESARESQALSLVIQRAMVEASREGWQHWNWGGTWASQDGVYRFKKRWGTLDEPYHYKIQLNAAALRSASRADIEREYPFFYVLPYSLLEPAS